LSSYNIDVDYEIDTKIEILRRRFLRFFFCASVRTTLHLVMTIYMKNKIERDFIDINIIEDGIIMQQIR